MLPAMSGPKTGQLPKFRNDLGVAEIRIGVKEFNCIGVSPPDDHPHVYLAMGADDTILCPYCSTSYRFDLRLGSSEAEPPDSVYLDPAVEAKSERSSFEQEPRRKAREHEADSLGDSGDGGSAAPLPLPLMDPAPAHGSP